MLRRCCLEPARVRARMRLACGSSRGHEPDSNPASSWADLRPLKVLSSHPLADLATGRGGNARWAFADSSSRHRPHQNAASRAASRAASGVREHRPLIGPIMEPLRCHRSAHLRAGRCAGESPSAHFAPSPLIREGRTSWGESRCRVPAPFAACAMAQGPPRCAAVLLDASNVARSGRLWIRLRNLPLGWKRRIAEPTPNHPRRTVRPSRTAKRSHGAAVESASETRCGVLGQPAVQMAANSFPHPCPLPRGEGKRWRRCTPWQDRLLHEGRRRRFESATKPSTTSKSSECDSRNAG